MTVLDRQVEQILYWAKRANQPSYPSIGATRAREHYARAVATLDVAPLPMHDVHDHRLVLPGRVLTVRQYTPQPVSWALPSPALLYLHGGGFTIGSIETHDRICRVLAAGSAAQVFSVDYRLAPEHRFPAAVDDTFDALAWLRDEATALGVDAGRIAVGGDSAGGTLAAAAAIHARDRGWPLLLQLLLYPGLSSHQQTPSHREFSAGYLLDGDVIDWFFTQYLRGPQDRHDWRFAPLLAPTLQGVAPAWIGLAQFDPLLDEGIEYAQRLAAAGVPVQQTTYRGMIHAFFQHAGFVVAARQAHADACAALRAAFGTG